MPGLRRARQSRRALSRLHDRGRGDRELLQIVRQVADPDRSDRIARLHRGASPACTGVHPRRQPRPLPGIVEWPRTHSTTEGTM